MDFTSEHKKESNFGKYFSFGPHRVTILGFNHEGTGEGEKEYVEVGFTDQETEQKEGKVRLYFNTAGNAPISFDTLRQIYVHNAPEDKKDVARDSFNEVPNTVEMVKLLNKNLIGKEMWYTKYYDKTATYEKEGQTYRSIRENVMGYEPKVKLDLMPRKTMGQSTAQEALSEAGSTFGTESDVPFKGGGSKKEDWM